MNLMPETAFDNAIARLREMPGGESAYQQKLQMIGLAKMLREWRKGAGYTQSQLATLMETSQSVIARLESFDNEHAPNIDTISAFARHCKRHLLLGATVRDVAVGDIVQPQKDHLLAL